MKKITTATNIRDVICNICRQNNAVESSWVQERRKNNPSNVKCNKRQEQCWNFRHKVIPLIRENNFWQISQVLNKFSAFYGTRRFTIFCIYSIYCIFSRLFIYIQFDTKLQYTLRTPVRALLLMFPVQNQYEIFICPRRASPSQTYRSCFHLLCIVILSCMF
jgi:hypothetical protein